MRGAPWDGLFYGFALEVIVAIGAVVLALGTSDFLTRAVAWSVAVATGVAAVRTVRRAMRLDEPPEHPTGRWWFGG